MIPQRNIVPQSSRLTHVAYRLEASQNGSHLVALGRHSKKLSIIGRDLQVQPVKLPQRISRMSPVAIDNQARYLSVNVGRAREQLIRNCEKQSDYLLNPATKPVACHFDEVGNLWLARVVGTEVLIDVLSYSDWDSIARAKLSFDLSGYEDSDELPNFTWIRFIHRFGSSVYLGLQDFNGPRNYLCDLDGSQLLLTRLSALDSYFSFVVAPHSGEIIGLDGLEADANGFQRILAPFEGSSQGQEQCPWPEPWDSQTGRRQFYAGCYIDLVHVLVATSTNRFFVLHTRSMEVIREITIEGIAQVPQHYTRSIAQFQTCGESIFVLPNDTENEPRKFFIIPIEELLQD